MKLIYIVNKKTREVKTFDKPAVARLFLKDNFGEWSFLKEVEIE